MLLELFQINRFREKKNILYRLFLLPNLFTFAIPNKTGIVLKVNAEVAQLVEHNLAKVGVARSNRVFCSKVSKIYT
jgi:hypothetical protein